MIETPLAPSRERQRPGSACYLITFTCYGTHLHGEYGRIDREHKQPGGRTMHSDPVLLEQSKGLMKSPRYALDAARREATLEGIRFACGRRGWGLLAAHIRTNHVHAVVQADRSPELVMIALKAYASRFLNELGIDPPDRRRWTQHGSTKYLWTREEIASAVRYVVAKQGDEMAVFCCAS